MPTSTLEELLTALDQLGHSAVSLAPKLAGALLLLIFGWVLGRVTRALTRRMLANVDKLLPPSSARDAIRSAVDRHRIDDLVGRLAFWVVLLLFAVAATETLGLPVVTRWLGDVAAYVPHLLVAALIGTAGLVAGRLARRATTTTLHSAGLEHADAVGRFVQVAVIVATFLVVVGQIGVKVTLLTGAINVLLAAVLGSAGLAFALGARSIVANILASHYVQRLYEVGEHIRIGDTQGRIVRVLPTAIVVETDEGEVAIPPDEFTHARSMRVRREA